MQAFLYAGALYCGNQPDLGNSLIRPRSYILYCLRSILDYWLRLSSSQQHMAHEATVRAKASHCIDAPDPVDAKHVSSPYDSLQPIVIGICSYGTRRCYNKLMRSG